MATKAPSLEASRILNASRVAQAADDSDVTNWDKNDEFIVVAQIDEAAGPWEAQYSLQWRDVTDLGTFADLASTGEIKWGTATDLVNGNVVLIGEKACDNTPSGSTWQDGEEVEGAAVCDSINLADECYTEIHFACNPNDADNGHEYEFQLYDYTNSAAIDVLLAGITIASGIVELHGSSAGQATVLGQAQGTTSLIGEAIGGATAEADLSGQTSLVGSSTGQATASAQPTATTSLIGASDGIAAADGILTALTLLIAASGGQAIVDGTLTITSGEVSLAGTSHGVADAVAMLNALVDLFGASGGSASAGAALTIYRPADIRGLIGLPSAGIRQFGGAYVAPVIELLAAPRSFTLEAESRQFSLDAPSRNLVLAARDRCFELIAELRNFVLTAEERDEHT